MVIEITYLWRLTNNNIFAEFDGDNITLSWAQNDEKWKEWRGNMERL